MKMLGKVLVHGCDIPGFNKKIEIYHPDDTIHTSIKGNEIHEAWYEDGEPIIIQCKLNKIEGIRIRGGVLTDIQCVYDKQHNAIRTVITYDDSKEMYEELRQFTLDAVPVDDLPKQAEHRMRCRVCGNIFCYTDDDIRKNDGNTLLSAVSAVGSLAAAFGGGTRLDAYAQQNNANRYSDKVIDFNRCPHCNSTDVEPFTEESTIPQVQTHNTISATDELKKFKELLDMGVITQEEFDAKKKQLLGV